MSVPTNIQGEVQANALFSALVGSGNVTLPTVDLFDEAHSVPWDDQSEVLQPPKQLTTDMLVSTFETVNTATAKLLKAEFDAGRITGAKYADLYMAMLQSSMQTALQFVLNKDMSFFSAAKTQADAIAANNQNETMRLQAMLGRANYALTKMKLATEDSAFGVSEYQRETLLPAQLALVNEQKEAQRAQTLGTRSDGTTPVAGLLGKQVALYEQQKQSYIEDIKIKASKIFADLWTIQKTVTGDLLNPPDAASTKAMPANSNDMPLNTIFDELADIATGA